MTSNPGEQKYILCDDFFLPVMSGNNGFTGFSDRDFLNYKNPKIIC